MKIKFRDKAIGITVVLISLTYIVFNYIVFPAKKKVDALNKEKEIASAAVSDIEPLLDAEKELKSNIKAAEKKHNIIKTEEADKTATSEEFLVYLGNCAEKNNVKVIGFSDLGTVFEKGLYKSYYDVEMSGMPFDVNRAIKELDTMGIKYSVGSLSFRQDKEYDYLKRFFDDLTGLSWYKEPDIEEDKQITQAPEKIPKEENKLENIKPIEPEITPPENQVTQKPQEEIKKDDKEDDKNIIHKNETVQGSVIEPEDNQGTVLPEDKNIEDRLNELLKTSALIYPYKVIRLTGITEKTSSGTDDMRISFTVCLTMFNEPTKETSIINIKNPEDENEIL